MGVTTIVLTGGPCAGKSTGLSRIEQELSAKGYKVFVVAETATELINGGIAPMTLDIYNFQKSVFRVQKSKEACFKIFAEEYAKREKVNVVIIFDRGLVDACAFMGFEEYNRMLAEFNYSFSEVRDSYDGVFHLVTAANGAESFYTLSNNTARSESIEQAILVDNETIKAWTGHPHFRVIDNKCNSFDEKLNHLMTEIYSLLGEPLPLEIERKFLIKFPDLSVLKEKFSYNKIEIIQTYLKSIGSDTERRVRQRGSNGSYTYYYTEKIGTGLSRTELERRISEKEYLNLLMEADTSLRQIRKDRYCFVYKNMYYELDIYPFWDKYAILEIELTNESSKEIEIPDCITCIREVTEENRFKNRQLALNNKIEDLL